MPNTSTAKPNKIVEWATTDTFEPRANTPNKVEPNDERKANGSLDGLFALGELNFMLNKLGLWSEFLNNCETIVNGDGVGLTKDDSLNIIFAVDKVTPANFIIGFGYKGDSASAAVINTIASNTLGFDTPNVNGTIAITGGTATNIIAFGIAKSIAT